MNDFQNKTAIITGSATGLGAEVALRLAAGGANVVINYSKSKPQAEATARKCKELGAAVEIIQADVSQDSDCRKLAADTLKRFGAIDILVNNAGTTKFNTHSELEGLTSDDFTRIYQVNVVGPYQMIRAVAPAMKKQKYGAVVNISSIAGVQATGSSVAYAASKAALNNMTRSLARALAPELRINAVCPGFIDTGWWESGNFGEAATEAMRTRMKETMPLALAGTAELVADAVIFLCGAGAKNITGETLLSDSGMHLNDEAGR